LPKRNLFDSNMFLSSYLRNKYISGRAYSLYCPMGGYLVTTLSRHI